jgi:transcriptional regulator with XRE-family HTH domain
MIKKKVTFMEKVARTEYEIFEQSSDKNRRLLREEELILEVTEELSRLLEKEAVTKAELARRLGKTKGFVSQVLAGGRNLTLRTIADVADVLGYRILVSSSKETKNNKRQESSSVYSIHIPPVPASGGKPRLLEKLRKVERRLV